MKVKKSLGIIGLMFSAKCSSPIVFPGTRSIHSMFMRYPIDILFIRNWIVVDKIRLNPWRSCKTAEKDIQLIIEHEAGKLDNLNVGDMVDIQYK